jgi:hypothetical protein
MTTTKASLSTSTNTSARAIRTRRGRATRSQWSTACGASAICAPSPRCTTRRRAARRCACWRAGSTTPHTRTAAPCRCFSPLCYIASPHTAPAPRRRASVSPTRRACFRPALAARIAAASVATSIRRRGRSRDAHAATSRADLVDVVVDCRSVAPSHNATIKKMRALCLTRR